MGESADGVDGVAAVLIGVIIMGWPLVTEPLAPYGACCVTAVGGGGGGFMLNCAGPPEPCPGTSCGCCCEKLDMGERGREGD